MPSLMSHPKLTGIRDAKLALRCVRRHEFAIFEASARESWLLSDLRRQGMTQIRKRGLTGCGIRCVEGRRCIAGSNQRGSLRNMCLWTLASAYWLLRGKCCSLVHTRSPALKSFTFDPTASTIPAISRPVTHGNAGKQKL